MQTNDRFVLDIPPFFFRRTVSVAPSSEPLERDASGWILPNKKSRRRSWVRPSRRIGENLYGIVTAEYLHIVYSEYGGLSKSRKKKTHAVLRRVLLLVQNL